MNHPIHPPSLPLYYDLSFRFCLLSLLLNFSHIRDDDDNLAYFEARQGLVYVSGESYRWIVVLVGINTSALIWL